MQIELHCTLHSAPNSCHEWVFMKCTCKRIRTFLCTWVWSRCSGMESSLTPAPARWKRMELPGTPQVEPCWSSCYKSVIFYLTMISSGKNTIEFLLNNLDILSLSSTHNMISCLQPLAQCCALFSKQAQYRECRTSKRPRRKSQFFSSAPRQQSTKYKYYCPQNNFSS